MITVALNEGEIFDHKSISGDNKDSQGISNTTSAVPILSPISRQETWNATSSISLPPEIGNGDPGIEKLDRQLSIRRRTEPNSDDWLLVIAAMILSIGSMAAVIAVLASEDGRLLDEWRFPTSINTVVSILSVVSKGGLAFAVSACLGQHKWNWFRVHRDKLQVFEKFDQASRGPWGGLNLLVWTRARYITDYP
jgi:hypothetical protein